MEVQDIILNCLTYLVKVGALFLAWTFIIYWLHRLSHIHSKYNPLWRIHAAHHREEHFPSDAELKFRWPQLFFWTGNLISTLDIYIVFTLPLIVLFYFFPKYVLPLLIFHYIYEAFLSNAVLDHNLKIKGLKTRFFAWGGYHLYHHLFLHKNYGLLLTLWDYIFGTAHSPQDDFVEKQIERRKQKGLVSKDFSLEHWPRGNIFGS